MRLCTLLFLIQDDQILLAMKKRGFGQGRWNGVGGKLDAGETIEQALVRECQEEIGVTPLVYDKIAVHDFRFPDGGSDQQVHTYFCSKWQGEPIETEEMAPQWYSIHGIPYDEMWQDDIIWLPQVLAGRKLTCEFVFDNEDNMHSAQFEVVESL
jgi:mutator protein MutT